MAYAIIYQGDDAFIGSAAQSLHLPSRQTNEEPPGIAMSSINTFSAFVLALALFAVSGVLVASAARVMRRRRAARNRVVEKPNSHYTSPLVRNSETRHRWHNIVLDRIHEVNRGEVVRLLAKLDALGVDALRPSERTFLDNIADLTDVRPAA